MWLRDMAESIEFEGVLLVKEEVENDTGETRYHNFLFIASTNNWDHTQENCTWAVDSGGQCVDDR